MDNLDKRQEMAALADALERDCGKCCNEHCTRKVEWPGRSFCEPCRFELEAELEMQELQEAADEAEKARNCFGIHVTWPSWTKGV
jgi:hypothetical protein